MSDFPQEIPTVQLADLRAKVLRGEDVSPDQYATVIRSIRLARKAESSRKKSSKEPKAQIDSEALLNKLVF
jgi:hypothetical protein